MKLAANKIDPFCDNPQNDVFFLLLYGPDEGLSAHRLERLVHYYLPNKDPFLYVKLSADELAKNPYILLEEALNYSFGGGVKVIITEGVDNILAPPIKEYLAQSNIENIIISVCSNLTPKSALRVLGEQDKRAVALPAYHDNVNQVSALIEQMSHKEALNLSIDARQYLLQELGDDRLSTLQELEKIAIFAKNKKQLDYDDVALLVGQGQFDINNIINCIFSGKAAEFSTLFDKLVSENISEIYITRQLLYYTNRLIEALHVQEKENCSPKQALETLSPKIFFKHIPMMQQHLQLWSYAKLAQAHAMLLQMEEECKKTSYDNMLIISRGCATLMALSRKK